MNRAFLDLLFNCLLGFVFLFVVSFLMVEVDKKKGNIETKAEFVITLTWDLNNPDDIDAYLKDPQGNIAWFSQKEAGLIHLDRDDLGLRKDVYYLPDGTSVEYPYNQEIITIRGYLPGMWTLNIHMYNRKASVPTNVRVEVTKLNPVAKTFIAKDYIMFTPGEEITVGRFELDASGNVMRIDDIKTRIVKDLLMTHGAAGHHLPRD